MDLVLWSRRALAASALLLGIITGGPAQTVGTLIVAHGADSGWNAAVLDMARGVRTGGPVRVSFLMGPAAAGTSLRFRVLIDGKAPGAAQGVDVDSLGNGTVTEQRMYQLIRQPAPITDRELEIEFPDPGVEVFDFTFG